MKTLKTIFTLCLLLLAAFTAGAQEVIQLYDGPAPGSEDWDWDEEVHYGLITGVSHPTLTVYRPEKPNGMGMVVCPGGGFCFLAYTTEGEGISKVLNEKGITCFVLKYRLFHDEDIKRLAGYYGEGKMDSISAGTIPLALDDAACAIRYVRSHATEYGIDPDKIGITGSSAGGCITMGTCMAATAEDCRPNFAVANYPYLSPHILREAPDKPLPLFIASCSDDSLVPVMHSVEFYKIWLAKKQQTELHIYQQGEHSFVCIPRGCEVDTWTDSMFRWMKDVFPDNFK